MGRPAESPSAGTRLPPGCRKTMSVLRRPARARRAGGIGGGEVSECRITMGSNKEGTVFARNSNCRPVALAVLLAVAGCATAGGRPEEQATGRIVVVVQHNNFRRATIYTSPQFGNKRLGVVEGNSQARFTLDWSLPRIQILAEIQGGGTIRWDPTVVPGSPRIWCPTRRRAGKARPQVKSSAMRPRSKLGAKPWRRTV